MTLNQIIVAALQRLDRGTDTQTISAYRPRFAAYANNAIRQIAEVFQQCRKESVCLDQDSMFNIDDLERECFKVIQVLVDGKAVEFIQDPPGSGLFKVVTRDRSAPELATVIYRFIPREVSATSDVPELPAYMHNIIHYYIVACERAGGDPDTQGTASVDFQLFNDKLNRLLSSSRGEPESYKFRNYLV